MRVGVGLFTDLAALYFHLLHGTDITVRDTTVSELGPTNKKPQLCFYGLEQPHYTDVEIDHPVAENDITSLTIVKVLHLLSQSVSCFLIVQLIARIIVSAS